MNFLKISSLSKLTNLVITLLVLLNSTPSARGVDLKGGNQKISFGMDGLNVVGEDKIVVPLVNKTLVGVCDLTVTTMVSEGDDVLSITNAPPRIESPPGTFLDWNYEVINSNDPTKSIFRVDAPGIPDDITRCIPNEQQANLPLDFTRAIKGTDMLFIKPSDKNERTIVAPEPSTILGLLIIGGIVIGASKKK